METMVVTMFTLFKQKYSQKDNILSLYLFLINNYQGSKTNSHNFRLNSLIQQ